LLKDNTDNIFLLKSCIVDLGACGHGFKEILQVNYFSINFDLASTFFRCVL